MKRFLAATFIGLCIFSFKILAFPAGDGYTFLGEMLFASPFFIVPWAAVMWLLPDFRAEED